MSDTSSSPRKKKATYAGSVKRKRRESAKGGSGSDGETTGNADAVAMPPPPSPVSVRKVKAQQNSNNSPSTPTSASKKPESRTNKRLSVASLSDIKGSPRTPGSKAPLSRFATPDGSERARDDADETGSVAGSIADSTTGKGSRKTEEERIEFIRSHRECREVEPHRAYCIPCDAWIPLNSSRRYSMQPWIVHIKACRSGKLGNRQVFTTPKSPGGETKADSDDDEQGSVVPSSAGADGRRRPRRTEEERERILKDDPRSGEVRPYEVECTTCKKWIQLGDKMRYRLESWNKHQQSCAGQIPSSRVATAERKLKLVNDASAKKFTTTSVVCKHCQATVTLEGEGAYNLTSWEKHKKTCPNPSAAPTPQAEASTSLANDTMDGTTETSAPPLSSGKLPDRSPPSITSTEATAVDQVVSGVSRGVKRPREEDDADSVDPDTRPATRPRLSGFNWLLAPFKAFVDGFKEGVTIDETEGPSAT
ncbi:hypothetical protein PENSPDRAFT_655990 [Peniophora sp. CONT]|nr:hypothetical protein PENSPDRAFT_655990 [Peniophora sp. CONT]